MKLTELFKVLSETNDVIIYKVDTDEKTLIYSGYIKNIKNDAEVVRVYPSLECHFVIHVKDWTNDMRNIVAEYKKDGN